MAVKWAVANGNWNAGATWNGGVVPTLNDDVFLNGFQITLPNSTYTAVAKSVSNGYCENTGNQGGTITGGQSKTISLYDGTQISAVERRISADVICDGQILFVSGNHVRVVINGNVLANSNLTDNNTSYHRGVHINGNVTANAYIVGQGTKPEIVVNGNVIANYQIGYGTPYLKVVGNLDVNINCSIGANSLMNINCALNSTLTTSSPLNVNGGITYKSTNNGMGVKYASLNIQNPDTFVWKDITEPRTNPFIIVTNYEINNITNYPAESDVKKDVPYAYGQLVGTFEPNYPPESVVLDGFEYGENMTGTMTQSVQVGCVTKEDVREGVPLIGMYEDGQQVVGTIIIPAEEDVREGVHYDNDKIGTLIVQGGGDRLRIADFGYYTNAQSDTYIVDITEADKPKFASAEERILIEMFPTLDLDNIPEMYFDDLFVKYLKYRLIVEYYRTAGVNSTFTPSEPTTEIVNYRNVTCEVWLNSANTYLNAWNKKFGLNKPPQKIRL